MEIANLGPTWSYQHILYHFGQFGSHSSRWFWPGAENILQVQNTSKIFAGIEILHAIILFYLQHSGSMIVIIK